MLSVIEMPYDYLARVIPNGPWNERWKNDLAGVFWLIDEEKDSSEGPDGGSSVLGGAGPYGRSVNGIRLAPNVSSIPPTSPVQECSCWRDCREARDMLPCLPDRSSGMPRLAASSARGATWPAMFYFNSFHMCQTSGSQSLTVVSMRGTPILNLRDPVDDVRVRKRNSRASRLITSLDSCKYE